MMTRATMQIKKIAYLVFMLEFEGRTGHLGNKVCHSLSRRGWNFILQRERFNDQVSFIGIIRYYCTSDITFFISLTFTIKYTLSEKQINQS